MPAEGTPAPDPPATPEQVDASGEAPESGDSGLADAADRIAELENLWLRALADLDNLRKRLRAGDGRGRGPRSEPRVAAEWLPVIDNLERALAHAEADPSAIVEGVRAVRDQAVALLAGSASPAGRGRWALRPRQARGGGRGGCARRRAGNGDSGLAARLRRRRAAAAPGGGGGGDRAELMADAPATSTRSSASRGRRHPTRSSGPTASWRARTTPMSTRTRAPRSGSRRSPRLTTCSPTRRLAGAMTPSAPTSAGSPRAWIRRRGRRGPGVGRRGTARRAVRPATAVGSPPDSGSGRRLRRPLRRDLRRPRPPRLGSDRTAPTRRPSWSLTVEEAYRGGRRTVTLQGPDGARSYEVDHPAGVADGQRIRLAGQGGQGSGASGRRATSTWWCVIAPHRRYRVEGRDIHVDLPVAPWEAALGAKVPVETPGGEAKVRVPPGTPAAGGCGCVVGACRTASGAAATSSPRSGSWCPTSADRRGAPSLRGAGRRLHLRPEEEPVSGSPLARPPRLDLDVVRPPSRAAPRPGAPARRARSAGGRTGRRPAGCGSARPSSPPPPGCSGSVPAFP